MVSVKEVEAINKAFYKDRPLVVVAIGGTSGLGEYAIRVLTSIYSSQTTWLRIYIVGRSASAADKIRSECSSHTNVQCIFVQAHDLTLLKDVDRVSAEIIRLEHDQHQDTARIDLLIQSQGQVVFGPRQDTSEGLDRTMSLVYYSRIRFIQQLLPLLNASTAPHVVSIYAAGLEGSLIRDDLALTRAGNYTFLQARSHALHMKTMAFEYLAEQHPTCAFTHLFPGMVITPSYTDPTLPMWFKVVWGMVGWMLALFISIQPHEAGMRMVLPGTDWCPSAATKQTPTSLSSLGEHHEASAATASPGVGTATGSDGRTGSGAYALDRNSDAFPPQPAVYASLRRDGFRDQAWEHTMNVFHHIMETGRLSSTGTP